MSIYYCTGYKYQLQTDYQHDTGIHPLERIDLQFISLDIDGTLTIRRGYAWDGCSGLAVDSSHNMRGGLVHDALYQLLREGHLPQKHRKAADKLLQKICSADGMPDVQAWLYYQAVRNFGEQYAKPQQQEVLKAP